jgi:hypothetical protein
MTRAITPSKPWRESLDIMEDDPAHGQPNHGRMALGLAGRNNGKPRIFLMIKPL